MKSTGIVRKIDDLGRIVVPKEIRKNLIIREGDNLEIFVNNDEIVLKKHSLMKKINDLSSILCDVVYNVLNYNVVITDTDSVLSVNGSLKKQLEGKSVSSKILELIKNREKVLVDKYKNLFILDNMNLKCSYALSTILVNGEALGLVLIFSEENILTETEYLTANIISSFISKYLEE